ncbi:heme-degrading domain-containing protein [Roseicitreum antarcticum]|uniref:Uncharacterized protein, UPF0303 family n=1 Tax=Roseicitreum antarcticum TaxID=564137 RepID=A0A1H2RA72_9RHOB|nr:heme-degrading domain-containing protein [Roseicitreum antarcticum]SDW16261.1 Uncharacterized protein, UPF0303 family [Roseicitreum antarcticum]
MTEDETLARIALEEERLQFPHFDEGVAWQIGVALVDVARAGQLPVVINIRTQDATLFHAALPGAAPANENWARRKSNVTLHCHKASWAMGLNFARRGITAPGADQGLPAIDFATHGGSFPVRLRGGRVVAAVTVSGLPQADDHAMVVTAIEGVLHTL